MLTKEYTKDGTACLVTFSLPEAISAERACLVGDFNGWDPEATPMQRQEDGSFAVTIELAAGHQYQFRYLVNDLVWHNDWQADGYATNPFGSDNSVVIV